MLRIGSEFHSEEIENTDYFQGDIDYEKNLIICWVTNKFLTNFKESISETLFLVITQIN